MHFIIGARLENISRSARLEYSEDVAPVSVHGEGDDLDPRVVGLDLAGRLYTVEFGHADVHDDHVRNQRRGQSRGLPAVLSLPGNGKLRISAQQ